MAKPKLKEPSKGQLLEREINRINEEYASEGMATFKKTPNNWVIQRKGPHIVGAKPVPSGICDYFGTSHYIGGRTVVFDAKESSLKKQFNLKNIKPEQMDHMREVTANGGLAFCLVWFTALDEYYCLTSDFIGPYWDASESEEAVQHIPIQDIRESCHKLEDGAYYLQYVIKLHNESAPE